MERAKNVAGANQAVLPEPPGRAAGEIFRILGHLALI